MRVIGLTGGMGAGKSTVARMLEDHGAHVIDADAVAREVVRPGEPALAAIVDAFGDEVLREDGALDRAALAAVVFADEDRRRDLEAVTHPAIRDRIDERLAVHERAADDRIVVLDHPLLVETGLASSLPVVVVVTAPLDTRVERLAEGRGIDREDARARIATQADDAQRLAHADHVVVNDGDEEDLAAAVAALWGRLTGVDG